MELPHQRGYLALYAAYPSSGPRVRCSNDDDFLAWSADGKSWKTFNVPILWRGMPELGLTSLYRGTLAYDEATDVLRVWFSALDGELNWWTYYVSYRYASLRRALDNAPLGALDGRVEPSLVERRSNAKVYRVHMP
jgi:hypothetical protein